MRQEPQPRKGQQLIMNAVVPLRIVARLEVVIIIDGNGHIRVPGILLGGDHKGGQPVIEPLRRGFDKGGFVTVAFELRVVQAKVMDEGIVVSGILQQGSMTNHGMFGQCRSFIFAHTIGRLEQDDAGVGFQRCLEGPFQKEGFVIDELPHVAFLNFGSKEHVEAPIGDNNVGLMLEDLGPHEGVKLTIVTHSAAVESFPKNMSGRVGGRVVTVTSILVVAVVSSFKLEIFRVLNAAIRCRLQVSFDGPQGGRLTRIPRGHGLDKVVRQNVQ